VSKSRYEQAAACIRALPPEVILRAAALCDGHGILKPSALIETGLSEQVVTHMTRVYHSDGSPKGTIFVRGRPVKQLEGVCGLHLLRFLAEALDVQYTRAFGRGTEAARIRQALHEHFGR
jgi:hypothetical protein